MLIFVDYYLRAAEETCVSFDDIPELPSITRLRQPLLLALSVSPLVLLSDIAPMSTNLTRVNLLRASES